MAALLSFRALRLLAPTSTQFSRGLLILVEEIGIGAAGAVEKFQAEIGERMMGEVHHGEGDLEPWDLERKDAEAAARGFG
jgi:hypothetical protein